MPGPVRSIVTNERSTSERSVVRHLRPSEHRHRVLSGERSREDREFGERRALVVFEARFGPLEDGAERLVARWGMAMRRSKRAEGAVELGVEFGERHRRQLRRGHLDGER